MRVVYSAAPYDTQHPEYAGPNRPVHFLRLNARIVGSYYYDNGDERLTVQYSPYQLRKVRKFLAQYEEDYMILLNGWCCPLYEDGHQYVW